MGSRAGGLVPHFLLLLVMIAGVAAMHVLGHSVPDRRATMTHAAPVQAMPHAEAGHAESAAPPARTAGHHGTLDPLEVCLAVLAGAIVLLAAATALAVFTRLISSWARDRADRPGRWTRGPPPLSLRLRRTAVLRI